MFEQFRKGLSVDDESWRRYVGYFQRLSVPAKTVLLREGEVSKKLFLIEKGCLRAPFNNGGKDVTFQFFFENNVVASIESFRKRLPSPVSIETLEPSAVWWIHKKDADGIMAEIKDIPPPRDLFLDAVFERTFNYMKHFFSSIKDTPLQRYRNLINDTPQIVQRVPQRYVASYLGITTVHLSRIKRRLAKAEKGPAIS